MSNCLSNKYARTVIALVQNNKMKRYKYVVVMNQIERYKNYVTLKIEIDNINNKKK